MISSFYHELSEDLRITINFEGRRLLVAAVTHIIHRSLNTLVDDVRLLDFNSASKISIFTTSLMGWPVVNLWPRRNTLRMRAYLCWAWYLFHESLWPS